MVRRSADAGRESPIPSLIPDHPSVASLAKAAQRCTACDLYKNATQVVFSEGMPQAQVMLVGEVPGHEEDLAGRPFVGPAGRLLRSALDEVGFDAKEVYFTNAVKHFKWEPRGQRRLHVKPNYREVMACRPWLEVELELVNPFVVVCLGGTAAQSFMGREFRVTQSRGQVFEMARYFWIATLHPAAILRMPTSLDRERARADFVSDLARVRELVLAERARSGPTLQL